MPMKNHLDELSEDTLDELWFTKLRLLEERREAVMTTLADLQITGVARSDWLDRANVKIPCYINEEALIKKLSELDDVIATMKGKLDEIDSGTNADSYNGGPADVDDWEVP